MRIAHWIKEWGQETLPVPRLIAHQRCDKARSSSPKHGLQFHKHAVFRPVMRTSTGFARL